MKRSTIWVAVLAALALLGAVAPAQVTAVPYGQPGLYQTPLDPALFLPPQ